MGKELGKGTLRSIEDAFDRHSISKSSRRGGKGGSRMIPTRRM